MSPHTTSVWSAVLSVSFLPACRPSEPATAVIALDEPLEPVELVAQRLETMQDTLGFHAATDLLPVPGGYFVIDAGNDRIVELDHDLEPVSVIGRSGSGPGELEAPLVGDVTPDGVAVVELSNGRISFFTFAGDFQRVMSLPGRWGDLAVGPGGDLFLASGPPETFLTRIGSDGRATPFASRPHGRSGAPEGALGVGRRDRVAVTESGHVAVLDNTAGHLLAYREDGTLLLAARLPDPVVESVRSRNEALRASLARQGRRVVGAHIAKGLKRQPDGRLLVLFTAPPYFGLLIEPSTWRGRLLSIPAQAGPWEPLMNAAAAVVEDRHITVLHSYGVTRYALGDGS